MVRFLSVISGKLIVPMLTINHPKTPLKATLISVFFSRSFNDLIFIIEFMLVFLCSRTAELFSGFPEQVCEILEDQRRYKHVKYGYGITIGDTIVPFG
jgi:hypothetical protein